MKYKRSSVQQLFPINNVGWVPSFPRITTSEHCSLVLSFQQCRSFYLRFNVFSLIFSPFRIYGVTWQQGYAYYTIHGNKDRFFIKVLVSKLSYKVPPWLLIATSCMKVSILMYVSSFYYRSNPLISPAAYMQGIRFCKSCLCRPRVIYHEHHEFRRLRRRHPSPMVGVV